MLLSTAPHAPTFPDWPKRRQSIVTVICEGPTAHWHQSKLIRHARGPVIAVNRAIQFAPSVPIDFWATVDTPHNLWAWSEEYRHPDLRFFTVNQALLEWIDLVPDIRKVYHWHASHMVDESLKDEEGQYPMVPTIFHVLAWLLSVEVKEVRLLGCDMAGSGVPGEDWTRAERDGFDLRWDVERKMLALSIKHYRAKGARIKRWVMSK